ncbi:MAG: IS3 family transposase [Candidatus Scalinduaceae bacterium]
MEEGWPVELGMCPFKKTPELAKGKWERVKKLTEEGISIALACRVLGVSRSGYYISRSRKRRFNQQRAKREFPVDEGIAEIIQEIIRKLPTYGYRMVWAILRFDRGMHINKKKVQRIMRLRGWQAKPVKRPSRGASESL